MPVEKMRPGAGAQRIHEDIKAQLLRTPFAMKVIDDAEMVPPGYRVSGDTKRDAAGQCSFFVNMTNALLGLTPTNRGAVLRDFNDAKKGPRWATGLIEAVPQFKSGAAEHLMEDLAVKAGTDVGTKMDNVSSILNGLKETQIKKFLQHVSNNPTGFDPAAIAAQIQAEGQNP